MSAIGILVPEFPQQTHIFFWREVVALREMGVDVALLSTRRPARDACRHDFATQARAETHYLFPPRLVTAGRLLAARPRRTARALGYLASLEHAPLKRAVSTAGLLVCAADLASFAEERQIRHVHAHSFADAAHVVAMAELLGGPSYSLTLHGDLVVYGSDHEAKARRSICVGCDGPHLQSQLAGIGYPIERVLPNWMGLDTARFAPSGTRAAASGELRLLTVARLNRTKGHAHALRGMKLASELGCNLTYTLAGEGPYRAEVEAEIRRLGLERRVTLLGTQSEEQVLALLQTHDVFVLPSIGLGEAGPISLMEAMSVGLPVVASIIGSTPHMVEHGVSGFLVNQGDETELSQCFVRLCRDLELRKSIGQGARLRAVDAFDCRNTTRRLLQFIEKNGGFQLERQSS